MNIQVHIYDVDLLHSLLSVPFLHKVTSTSYQRTVPYPHVDDMTVPIIAWSSVVQLNRPCNLYSLVI
jgi:hypothetical protein